MRNRLMYFIHTISYRLKIYRPFLYLYKNRTNLLFAESYYPEISTRKSVYRILCNQIYNIMKYGWPNEFYYLYGLDRKGFRSAREFVDYTLFYRRREYLNHLQEETDIPILRDKLQFGMFAEKNRIPTPKNLGFFDKCGFHDIQKNQLIEYDRCAVFGEDGIFFLKPLEGECGRGVFKLEISDNIILLNGIKTEVRDLRDILNGGVYLAQRSILNQHHLLESIFEKSLNTIRLVTVYNKVVQKVLPLSAVLRVGVGDNHVDNWAAGGLSIGIDLKNGKLKKYGFYKPGKGTKTAFHPNSNLFFEDYLLPYWQEILNSAIKFHEKLRGLHSIGWDVAITENGPVFIEGNDNWELSLMQACNGGLNNTFEDFFSK